LNEKKFLERFKQPLQLFLGKASVGKREILFEQRNARKDTKKFHGNGFFCANAA